MAALAYAPCLPAADRLLPSANVGAMKNDRRDSNDRKPSICDASHLMGRPPSALNSEPNGADLTRNPGKINAIYTLQFRKTLPKAHL